MKVTIVTVIVWTLSSSPSQPQFIHPNLKYSLALRPFNSQCSHHIETSQFICSTSHFYMTGALAVKGLRPLSPDFFKTCDGLCKVNVNIIR